MVECYHCGELPADDSANVMVDSRAYFSKGNGQIPWLRVYCKPCTKFVDRRGGREELHNLWELTWVRDRPFYLVAKIFSDLVDQPGKWSADALDDFLSIVYAAHGELFDHPMLAALSNRGVSAPM